MAASALDALRDVLVPPRCAGCGRAGAWFCVECRDQSDPVVREVDGLVVTSAGAHEGPLRNAVHRLKYRNEPGLASELGRLVAARMAADLARGARLDAVVPVPLHRVRARERGYDQAAALAATVHLGTGLPLRPALHRLRSGPPQARLGRTEREHNVRGAFVGLAGAFDGLHVALIDDVVTTGATLRDAATAARACGARGVRAYTVGSDE